MTIYDCLGMKKQLNMYVLEMECIPKGQSSPGNLHSGQQPSNGILQIPQLSSLATQRQVATPAQPKNT
jgi:hypothetical protein